MKNTSLIKAMTKGDLKPIKNRVRPSLNLILICSLLIINNPAIVCSQESAIPCSNNITLRESLNEIKQQFIGDILNMDKYSFSSLRNYSKKTLKISDFSHKKLIILDFWSKSCTSCISGMPKLQSLQNKFESDIQIIFVTGNTIDQLLELFARSATLRNVKLPFVFGDSILYKKIFPHYGEPYQVWIDRNGKIIATTHPTETNEININNYLEKQEVTVLQRKDTNIDAPIDIRSSSVSLIDAGNGTLSKYLIAFANLPKPGATLHPIHTAGYKQHLGVKKEKYYSLFLSRLPFYDIGSSIDILTDSAGRKTGFKLLQLSLESIIRYAYKEIFAKTDIQKIFVEGSAINSYEEISENTNMNQFTEMNVYSYESCVNDFSEDKVFNILKLDIERFFGLKLTSKTRLVQCAILRVIDSLKLNKFLNKNKLTKGEVIQDFNSLKLINTPISKALKPFYQANQRTVDPLILNETNLQKDDRLNMTLSIESKNININNIQKINSELSRYGLKFYLETKKLTVPVLENSF